MRSSRKAPRPAVIAACSSRPTSPRRSAPSPWCSRSSTAVNVPVIAAGGIGDASSIAAAFALGAVGRADRHRLSVLPRGHDLGAAPGGAGGAWPRDGHRRRAERTAGARNSESLHSRAGADQSGPPVPIRSPRRRLRRSAKRPKRRDRAISPGSGPGRAPCRHRGSAPATSRGSWPTRRWRCLASCPARG